LLSLLSSNLLERRWSRNATLVQGLVALEIIEELGFGLDRMVAAMAAARLPAPEFREVGDTFVVTLYGPGAALLQAPKPQRREVQREQAPGPAARSPEERLAWVLEHVRTVGPLSPGAYATLISVSIDTAKRDLRELVARGRIRAEGTTRDRRYVLSE
jgi:predicted HTH transcriptional regulator